MMVRNKSIATNIPIIKTLAMKHQTNGHLSEETKSTSVSSNFSVSSHKSGNYYTLGSPINTKDLVKGEVKRNVQLSPKTWSAEKGFGETSSTKLLNGFEREKKVVIASSPVSEKVVSPVSKHVNGFLNTSTQHQQLHDNSKMMVSTSLTMSPGKNGNISDQGLFHISRMKAQPALYRKMFGIYKEGSEVLTRWSDGLYYLGTICKVSDFEHRCQVQFEDKSTHWVHFKDMQSINSGERWDDDGKVIEEESESDLTCALCRDGNSESPNDIVLCDKCGQGYHQLCHVPTIDMRFLSEEDAIWQCRTCIFAAVARRGGADSNGPGAAALKNMKQVLPYDISSLSWDKGHKTNTEEIYCYCGGPGDWYLKMLQCCRCQQWFHEACIQCLEFPILYGDRFFLFVCSCCNQGNEYVKRLPMRWVDVVHLVLYNITIAKMVKYYDFAGAIVPFFAQNWESLQLGDLVHEASTRNQLKDRILETLQNNKTRFQCGSESKKAKMSWGLRTRSPPVPPTVSVPGVEVIDDDLLKSLDLRHGSLLLSDSPTPLKRNGPGDGDDRRESSSFKKMKLDSVEGNWDGVKNLRRNEILASGTKSDISTDNIFDRLSHNFHGNFSKTLDTSASQDQPKRRRGRPRKEVSSSPKLPNPVLNRGRGRPSMNGNKMKRESIKDKKGHSSFASDNIAVIPLSELFQYHSTQSVNAYPGHDAQDKELRQTMARYFSAEGRIACGERFRVVAKRTVQGALSDSGTSSKVEYLIEWEGYTAKELHESIHRR